MRILFGSKTRAFKAVVSFASATLLLGATLSTPGMAAESKQSTPGVGSADTSASQPLQSLVPAEVITPLATFKPVDIPVFLYEDQLERDFADRDFAVRLHLVAGAPKDGVVGLPEQPVVNENGVFSIPTLKFSKPGTYKLIYRQIPQAARHTLYDESLIMQTVVVAPVPGAPNKFSVTASYTQAGKPTAHPQFANRYSTQFVDFKWELSVSAVLQLAFEHQPQPVPAGQFALQLSASADNPQVANGSVVSAQVKTGKFLVGADGRVDFGQWLFNQPGTYEFTVQQVAGQDALVKYDVEPVRVLVRVARPQSVPADAPRDADGFVRLRPTVQFIKGNRFAPRIEFANVLQAPLPVESFETRVVTQEVPFPVLVESDSEAFVGSEVVVNPGVTGFKEVTLRQRLLDGKPAGEPQVVAETVLRQMEPRVVRRGVKPLPVTTEVLAVSVETVPVETVFEDDTTLGSGQVLLVSEGVEGQIEVRTVQTYVGGIAQGEPQLQRVVVRAMQPTVVRRGVMIAGAKAKPVESEAELALPQAQLEAKDKSAAGASPQLVDRVEDSAELGVFVISRPSIPKAAEAGSSASIELKKRKQVAGPEKQKVSGPAKPKKDAPNLVVAQPKARLANTGAGVGSLLGLAASFAMLGLFAVVAVRRGRQKSL